MSRDSTATRVSGQAERKAAGRRALSILAVVVAAVLASHVGYFYFVAYLHPSSYQNRGAFGDLFGGLNALFSGLALAGIVTAIYLQNIQLEIQQNEHAALVEDLEIMRKRYNRNAQMNIAGHKVSEIMYHLTNVGKAGTRIRIKSLNRTDLSEIPERLVWKEGDKVELQYRDELQEDRLQVEYCDDMGDERRFVFRISIQGLGPERAYHEVV